MQLKFPLGALVAALTALLLPAAASASTVTVENGTLVLRAAPGERNVVGVAPDDTDRLVQIDDVDRPAYPAGVCELPFWDPTAVACTPQPGGVRIELGDGDDSAIVYGGTPGGGPMVLLGGEGADELHARTYQAPLLIDGGPGADKLTGGMVGDTLVGGPGDDYLSGLRGGDHLLGGEGADQLLGDDHDAPGADTIDGGPGIDRIDHDWAAALDKPQPPIEVSLDGAANDGRPGEGDNVIAVETIHLSNPATLTAGSDPVDFEVFNSVSVSSRLTGSPGADRLRSYDAADTIDAGGGDDWVEAGYGDDTIAGGPGRDTVNADAGSGSCNFLVCRRAFGNDTIDVRDGEVDSVECGPGNDTVTADRIDRLENCETVMVSGPGGPAGRGCVVPKLRRGAKLAAARAALRRAGCPLKVVRVNSKLKRGRVLGTSPAAGKALKTGGKVTVRVSGGPRKRGGAGASSVDVVSPPAPVLNPVKLRCVNLSYGGRACGKRFGDRWEKGWWSDPAEFEIVDVRLHGDTEMTVPDDESKSFKGDGYTIVKATPGVRGKFRLPSRTATVPVSSAIAKPVTWKMESQGAWTTRDGVYGCGVRKQPAGQAKTLAGVVSADKRKGTIRVQWSLVPAGFDCPEEGAISNPEFEGLPSEAMTVEYRAAGFRGAELLKLPVSIEWEGVQSGDDARLMLDWGGSVVLRRVHHRIGRASASAAVEEPPAGAKTNVLRIAAGGIAGRFLAPPTVRAGEYLEVVNETDPKKVGPHTISLVDERALPRTAKARQACFAPGHLCDAIARWHRLDFKTGKVGTDLVDVGPEGWSTMGAVKKKGDSWFTDRLGERVVQQVTAQPRNLYFVCLVHPWMQGKTKVLPAGTS